MDSSFIDTTGIDEPILPIELKATVFRPFAYRVLSKKYGLNVQTSALEHLSSYVGRRFGTKWKRDPKTLAFLDALGKLWKEQERGIFVDGDGVDQVIKEIVSNEKGMKQRIINAQKIREAQKNNMQLSQFNNNDILTSDIGDVDEINANSTIGQLPDLSMDGNTTTFDTSILFDTHAMNGIDIDTSDLIDWKSYFKVLDPNHYTCFQYDIDRKQFNYAQPEKNPKTIKLPKADANAKFYRSRIELLRDRIYRNGIFSRLKYNSTSESKVQNQMHQPKHITAVKNLLGRNEQRFILFGLVTLNSFGVWQLQDDSDKIELVLKQCIFAKDTFFVSGNYLLVDGFYSSAGKFHVLSMEHPPAEDRESTIDAFGDINLNWDYSKNGKTDPSMKRLTHNELKKHTDHKIVVLGGNLFLDDIDILNKLKKVLQEIETELKFNLESRTEKADNVHDKPIAIVFNGPFVSNALTVTEGTSSRLVTSSGSYKAGFDNLANILQNYKIICDNCKLIFVPGDEDPWLSMITKNANSIWPKMKIPSIFGLRLTRLVKDIEWASNPCRLSYLLQDIVLMRDDIGESFRRHDFTYLCELSDDEIENAHRRIKDNNADGKDATMAFGNEPMSSQLSFLNGGDLEIDKLTIKEVTDSEKFNKIVKTLLNQGFLSPFHTNIRTILPNYWLQMNLMPLPNCILMSDTTSPTLSTMYKGCLVANVGSFANKGHVSYLEYYPSSQTANTKTVY